MFKKCLRILRGPLLSETMIMKDTLFCLFELCGALAAFSQFLSLPDSFAQLSGEQTALAAGGILLIRKVEASKQKA